MRVLVTSLITYTSPHNDGKLEELARQVESLTVATGDIATIWGGENQTRSGDGYRVHVLPLRFTKSKTTSALVGLEAIAADAKPTLIHIECEPWQAIAVQSVRLARRLGVPVGIQFAECGPRLKGAGGAVRRVIGAWVLKRCDYAIGWSEAGTRVAQQLAPGIRTETSPATGVAIPDETPVAPDEWFGAGSDALPKLAFVGRFSEEKGIHEFLAVADDLARRRPIRVAIAGGQGDQQGVQQWAATRPWAKLCGMLPRATVGSLLATADALVCPSITTKYTEEQFGKAAVEAMIVGTPVFAYDCGALASVIGAGGVVVPEHARTELADALEQYFGASADDRDILAKEARAQAAGFTDRALADKMLGLWSTCAGTHA
jgi:glycosyltransferase involved in cell wall biosynthesis